MKKYLLLVLLGIIFFNKRSFAQNFCNSKRSSTEIFLIKNISLSDSDQTKVKAKHPFRYFLVSVLSGAAIGVIYGHEEWKNQPTGYNDIVLPETAYIESGMIIGAGTGVIVGLILYVIEDR